MLEQLPRYIIAFLLLVYCQVVVFNYIHFSNVISTYPYILFLLLLPSNTNTALSLALAFVLGITVDYFSDAGGMHAAACVPIAYIRPFILRTVGTESKKDNYTPTIKDLGFNRYVMYAAIMVLIHHTILFYFEAFEFSLFFSTFLKMLGSSVLTLIFIVLLQYIFIKEPGK
ncbi:MAG: rod shape-determining protein MreD [Bacteroidetes bacterium]|nr:rod shape-determining protein MreD [Bacteroidota bacterium]